MSKLIKVVLIGLVGCMLSASPAQSQIVLVRGQTVKKITANQQRIVHKGVTFHYANGAFYRQGSRGFTVVAAPVGLRVKVLPSRAQRITASSRNYFYHNGTFYRKLRRSGQFVVVKPPVGARVASLPKGHRVVKVKGVNYYRLDGFHYRKVVLPGRKTYYEVVRV